MMVGRAIKSQVGGVTLKLFQAGLSLKHHILGAPQSLFFFVCCVICHKGENPKAEPGHQPYKPAEKLLEGFPGGAVVKNPPANAGDTGSSPGLGISHMPWSN